MRAKFLSLMLTLFAIPAYSLTVTFDDVDYGEYFDDTSPTTYTESGVTFTASSRGLGYYMDVGSIHIDDDGTFFTSTVIVTTGDLFTPESMEITEFGEPFLQFSLEDPAMPGVPSDAGDDINFAIYTIGVLVQAFRSGVLVAEERFSAVENPVYEFDARFAFIDELRIIADPDKTLATTKLMQAYPGLTVTELECTSLPCSHFNLNSFTITDPEPEKECRLPPKHKHKHKHWKKRGKHKKGKSEFHYYH